MGVDIHEIRQEEGLKFKSCCKLLLMTIDDEDRNVLLESMQPLNNHPYIYKAFIKYETYYIGSFGAYGAILVSCKRGRAPNTITLAINTWEPEVIVMLGTGFGVDRERQRIGDVLISEQIIPYDGRNEEESGTTHIRPHPASSVTLQNRFSNIGNWSFILTGQIKAKSFLAPILSGDVSINKKTFRDKLVKKFKKVEGGAMEADGMYSFANDAKIDWIVIKGISNFADGELRSIPGKNKLIAIKSAISLTKSVFSSEHAFEYTSLILSKNCRIETPPSVPPPKRFLFKNVRNQIGYKDSQNNLIIQCRYIDGQQFSEGLASVKIGVTEDERLRFIEEKRSKGNSLEDIQKELRNLGKWGYVDTKGNTVIEPKYDKVRPFKNGKARAEKNGKILHINKKGQEI